MAAMPSRQQRYLRFTAFRYALLLQVWGALAASQSSASSCHQGPSKHNSRVKEWCVKELGVSMKILKAVAVLRERTSIAI